MSRNVLIRFLDVKVKVIASKIYIINGKTLMVIANEIIMIDGFISSLLGMMLLPSLLL